MSYCRQPLPPLDSAAAISWIMNLLMNIDMIVIEPIQLNHPSITLYVHVQPCLFSDQSLASTLLLHPFLSSFYKSLYLPTFTSSSFLHVLSICRVSSLYSLLYSCSCLLDFHSCVSQLYLLTCICTVFLVVCY